MLSESTGYTDRSGLEIEIHHGSAFYVTNLLLLTLLPFTKSLLAKIRRICSGSGFADAEDESRSSGAAFRDWPEVDEISSRLLVVTLQALNSRFPSWTRDYITN